MSNSNEKNKQKNEQQIQSEMNEKKSEVNETPTISKRKQNFIERCRDASIVRKIVFVLIVLLTALIVYGGKSAYEFLSVGLSPVDPDSQETIAVEIPLGSSSTQIAEILEEEGLINNVLIYRLFIKVNNYADFQAGEYQLSPSMTLAELSETLQTGTVSRPALYTVTIPEGRTLEEIAVLFENNANIDADEFMELMNDDEYISSLIDLYPTYCQRKFSKMRFVTH